jgi:GMP synthase-like glutamine amidotransferase
LKVGILEAGGPPEPLAAQFGDYPAMFRRLLGAAAFRYERFDLPAGQWPKRPEACEAYLITGSPAGVYEDLPWIGQLLDFLRQARGQTALVGVCFGHQAMAQAFGGQVEKSASGWGVGLHRYRMAVAEPWMDPVEEIALPASHQDQVTTPPPGAVVLGGSAFSPFGMLAYPGERAFSIQLHPEFEPDFAAALIAARRGKRLSEAEADAATLSLSAPNDRSRVAVWIRRFLGGG